MTVGICVSLTQRFTLITQVFPDEFHLQTLTPFLKSCAELQPGVNVKNIIISLMDRLSAFSQRATASEVAPGSPDGITHADVQLFDVFSDQVASIVQARQQDMLPEDVVSLQVALVNLAHKCYPDRVDYVDKVLLTTVQVFQRLGIERLEHNTSVSRELARLMKIPIDNYNDLLRVLELQHYAALMEHLDYQGRKQLAIYLLNNALENDTVVPSQEQTEQALGLSAPLITAEQGEDMQQDADELADEQSLLARFVHQMRAQNADQQYLILSAARRILAAGGAQRIRYTLPPLVFQAYQLAFR